MEDDRNRQESASLRRRPLVGRLAAARWGVYLILRRFLTRYVFLSYMSAKSVILLAEDRDDDIELIRRAFKEGQIDNQLFIVKNGEEALSYLKGEAKYQVRDEYPLPDLLLLDLKMPRMDGFDVLRWVRLQPGFSSLLVVVLTSSEEIRDVNKAYQLGA